MVGRSEFLLDKLKDQQRRKVTLEVKHHAENIRVVGEISLDLVWLHSQTELCKSLLAEYDQERRAMKVLLDKHKATLVLLQKPFEPLSGYEIAPKVSKIDPSTGAMVKRADMVTKGLFKGRAGLHLVSHLYGSGFLAHMVTLAIVLSLVCIMFGTLVSSSKPCIPSVGSM